MIRENITAKKLQSLRKVVIVLGVVFGILAIFVDVGVECGAILIIAGITSTLFECFSEVVELLYKSHKTQEAILARMSEQPTTKTILEDIESHLPQI